MKYLFQYLFGIKNKRHKIDSADIACGKADAISNELLSLNNRMNKLIDYLKSS